MVAVIFLIAFILLAITFLILSIYFPSKYESDKRQIIAWRQLARANNLFDSIPGKSLTGAYLAGDYRSHYLKLETFQKNNQEYTRLTLDVPALDGPSNETGEEGILDEKSTIDNVIGLLAAPLSYPIKGNIMFAEDCKQIRYEQASLEADKKYLQFLFDLLHKLIVSYPILINFGGEAISPLQEVATVNSALQPVIIQILQNIGRETAAKSWYQSSNLVCPQCLARFTKHISQIGTVEYYGCRMCNQSRQYLDIEGRILTVLDSQMTERHYQEDKDLRVNWLAYRQLFSFDEVHIIHATDEDVERFAVQVGNDTDPVRKPKYSQMRCLVSPECGLSENTLRILRRTFGEVEIKQ